MKKIVGIVAEYNPFHNGHKHQIDLIREKYGKDAVIIAVMSGNFVQRGEPAIITKTSRAEIACRNGVNIVVDLPLPWSIMSAQGFADGGVSILNALGINILCFGAENPDSLVLSQIADISASDDATEEIKEIMHLSPDLSFPKARQKYLSKYCDDEISSLIKEPNIILAIEYINAIKRINTDISIYPIERIGARHDSFSDNTIKSAYEIRKMIYAREDVAEYIPQASFSIIHRELQKGRGPVSTKSLETALLSRLRERTVDEIACLPDTSDGVAQRIYEAIKKNSSFEDIADAASTKRYTVSRMRRTLIMTALGLKTADFIRTPPYIRLLAADADGCRYLKSIRNKGVTILSKAADITELNSPEAENIMKINSDATDLYVLGYSISDEMQCGTEFRTSPVII